MNSTPAAFKAAQILLPDLPDHQERRLAPLLLPLVEAAGVPIPKILLMDHPHPNAMAIGPSRQPKIILSAQLLDLLSDQEIAGVLAHELAHLRSRDALLMTGATILVLSVVAISELLIFLAHAFRRDGGFVLIPVAVLSTLLAIVLHLAIGQDREFAADAAGAQICGHPEWMISALEKLQGRSHPPAHDWFLPGAADHLRFVLPQAGLLAALSTHPPISARIEKLTRLLSEPSLCSCDKIKGTSKNSFPAGLIAANQIQGFDVI